MTYEEAVEIVRAVSDAPKTEDEIMMPHQFYTGLMILSKYDDVEPGIIVSASCQIYIRLSEFSEEITEEEVRELVTYGFGLSEYLGTHWHYMPNNS